MNEIKSTLDLVMERTKNLTMNEAEKEGHRKADLKRRLAGLMQKYQDQAIKPTELLKHLNELKNTFGHGVENRMTDEILGGIDVEADNDRRLTLLTGYFGLEIATLKKIQDEFKQALQAGKTARIDILKSQLSEHYGFPARRWFQISKPILNGSKNTTPSPNVFEFSWKAKKNDWPIR